MKRQYYLPIAEPQFVCSNTSTCANAIIIANVKGDDLQKLLCSKYINCYFHNDAITNKFVISMFDVWCTQQRILQYQYIDFLKETYKQIDPVQIIKNCIIREAYVLGSCNRKYIEPNTDENTPFEYVIVGFDDFSNEFILYGVNTFNKLERYNIGYKEFFDAILDIPDDNIVFTLRLFNKSADISLDLKNIIFELNDYINSHDSRNHDKIGKIHGFNAIRSVADYFMESIYNGQKIPENDLYKFYMHKHFMRNRIECLASHDVIDKKWIDYAVKVENIGHSIQDLGGKYNNLNDKALVRDISNDMIKSITLEEQYLPFVLNELEMKSIYE